MMIENYLSTNATYPITYGTAITVACDPQYDLLGSEVITCESGIVYSHSSRRPKCVSKGMLISKLQNVQNALKLNNSRNWLIYQILFIFLIKLIILSYQCSCYLCQCLPLFHFMPLCLHLLFVSFSPLSINQNFFNLRYLNISS